MIIRMSYIFFGLAALGLVACGESGGAPEGGGDGASGEAGATLQIASLPDPCDWLSAEEAGALLGLTAAPGQMPMGDDRSAGRSCVFTDADQTAWLNITYQGLNPQIFDARGLAIDELIEMASMHYANGMAHLKSGEVGGFPAVTFGDADQTILVVFTNIGKARDLPEGISDRLSFSTIYNVTMTMMAPDLSQEQRVAALESLADRPVSQLRRQTSG